MGIQFKFSFIPCDMKWLATYSGEVSNAFYYFSSFGNLSKDGADTVNASLGNKADNTWHPWNNNTCLEKADGTDTINASLGNKADNTWHPWNNNTCLEKADGADTINASLGNKADNTWHPWNNNTCLEKAEKRKFVEKTMSHQQNVTNPLSS